jgi:purine-binding chemotaxis protein CheW
MNLRGKVIPVIDLRLKFGMPAGGPTDESCIIVVEVHDTQLGVVVDRVCEVLDIPAENVANAPAFGARVDTAFISGMGKTGSRFTILLDIAVVLSGEDSAWAREAADDGDAQAI